MKIIFYKGQQRFFNRAVSWLTVGPYSHCEVITDEYEDGSVTCWSSSSLDGGVRQKRMTLHPENWDIVDVPFDIEQAKTWLNSKLGVKYDTLGLVGFTFRPITGNHNKLFCSELVAELIGLPAAWRYDPNTLKSTVSLIAIDGTNNE